MAAGLRQISENERERVGGRYGTQHGQVLAFAETIGDDDGRISAPLLRVPLLMKLEHKGAITRRQAEAGATFHTLFQRAALDSLKAADLSRIPMPPGTVSRDLAGSTERCRRLVSEAMTSLGGAGSPAASAVWHIVGLEWRPAHWAAVTRRHHTLALGVLVAGLGMLASHFAGGRRAR